MAETHTYNSGTAVTETVPAGVTLVTIKVWGAGGPSGQGNPPNGGGGGGGGGYSESDNIACSPGQTTIFTVGKSAASSAIAASSVSSGTLAITTMTANPGQPGGGTRAALGLAYPQAPPALVAPKTSSPYGLPVTGLGGTATGGTTLNLSGGNGEMGEPFIGGNGANGYGGANGLGQRGDHPGAGAPGSYNSTVLGSTGQVQFIYT